MFPLSHTLGNDYLDIYVLYLSAMFSSVSFIPTRTEAEDFCAK